MKPRVAILVEEHFEDSELASPRDALLAAGMDPKRLHFRIHIA